jgi:hypothetical protein
VGVGLQAKDLLDDLLAVKDETETATKDDDDDTGDDGEKDKEAKVKESTTMATEDVDHRDNRPNTNSPTKVVDEATHESEYPDTQDANTDSNE